MLRWWWWWWFDCLINDDEDEDEEDDDDDDVDDVDDVDDDDDDDKHKEHDELDTKLSASIATCLHFLAFCRFAASLWGAAAFDTVIRWGTSDRKTWRIITLAAPGEGWLGEERVRGIWVMQVS